MPARGSSCSNPGRYADGTSASGVASRKTFALQSLTFIMREVLTAADLRTLSLVFMPSRTDRRRSAMRIGELAKRSGVPARMLRYYEEQGLVVPRRLDNGYRVYDDHLLDRVQKVRGLIDAGIPTRIISDILPCLDQPQEIVVADPDPKLRELLIHERERMSQKIDLLIQNRDAITRYIEALDDAATQLAQAPCGLGAAGLPASGRRPTHDYDALVARPEIAEAPALVRASRAAGEFAIRTLFLVERTRVRIASPTAPGSRPSAGPCWLLNSRSAPQVPGSPGL